MFPGSACTTGPRSACRAWATLSRHGGLGGSSYRTRGLADRNLDKAVFEARAVNRQRPSRLDLEVKIGELERRLETLRGTVNPIKFDLELGIHDFGPIGDAHIRFRPLTVFVGPNNSGKSYAALLAHSAVSLLGSGPPAAIGASDWNIRIGARRGHSRRTRTPLKAGNSKNEFLVTSRALGALSRDTADAIAEVFSGQIEKNFSARPSSLVRSGRPCASIRIAGIAEILIPRNERKRPFSLKHTVNAARVHEALTNKNVNGVKTRTGDGGVIACTFPGNAGGPVNTRLAYDKLLPQVLMAAFDGHGRSVPATTSYLPAARSGIMEAYKTILASVARSYPHNWDDPRAAPHMKAIDYEFLATMLEVGNKKGQFSRIANELERDALHGKITLRYAASGLAPDIYYARQREMPIHQASSAVSELAPLVLFLRHVVKKGYLLIIEEPESHMHPKSQVAVARCIVRLVRAGLNVIVTTHSTYIMERFSAYLRAGQMTAAQRSRVGIGKDLYLEADDIAPYLFETKGNRTTVKAIDHSPHEGISQEEFMRVNQALHEENIRADKFVG